MRPMTRRTGAAPVGITCALCTVLSIDVLTKQIPAGERAATLRLQGLDHGYNLDYPEALRCLRSRPSPLEPRGADHHRLAAATLDAAALRTGRSHRRGLPRPGALQRRRGARHQPVSQLRSDIISIAQPRWLNSAFATSRNDAEAHFQVGAVAGLRASYVATVEGRVRDSVGVAPTRLQVEHEALADARSSARRTPVSWSASIDTGSPACRCRMRLMARIAGFDSGRETGLGLVEHAARHRAMSRPMRCLRWCSSTTANGVTRRHCARHPRPPTAVSAQSIAVARSGRHRASRRPSSRRARSG